MPRRKSGPRMYQRPGRRVWYCAFSDAEKHISLGTEDEGEAKIVFAQLLESRRIRELAPNEKDLTDLFAEARQRADTNNTAKTAYELHLNLRRILKWLDERNIYRARQVTKQVVEDYKTSRRFKVGPARINRELDSWCRAWRVAVELRCAPRADLDELFERLREPRPEPHRQVHTKAQLTKFLRHVVPGYRPLFRGVLGCALRDEEMRHIEPKDVRQKEVVVTPKPGWTTKGYRYRTVPISPTTRKALLAWVKAREAGELSIDKKWVWKLAQRAAKAAKVPGLSLHDLRHACASHWYHAGVPMKTISMWLGHRDVATTERYLGVVESGIPKGVKLTW